MEPSDEHAKQLEGRGEGLRGEGTRGEGRRHRDALQPPLPPFPGAGLFAALLASLLFAGVLAYTFQIYFDFSGYSDMAIGIALLFGYRLCLNFDSPYQSSSITEFWRRWHISLSTWLRDYLYISLGGNRNGKLNTYINQFITMLLGGLWHGASPMFILWGALHGVAFGGGLQIALGADIRIVHPDTRIAIMEMRWGLVPDMGGYALWRGLIRDDFLRELTYTNREFSGEEAHAFGLATHVDADPLARATAIAATIADRNPHAIRGAKRLANSMPDKSTNDLLMEESLEQHKLMRTRNQMEAVMAGMEKRKARYEDV